MFTSFTTGTCWVTSEDRTHGTRNHNPLLYLLSYSHHFYLDLISFINRLMVRLNFIVDIALSKDICEGCPTLLELSSPPLITIFSFIYLLFLVPYVGFEPT